MHAAVQVHKADAGAAVLHPHRNGRTRSDGLCTDWLRQDRCDFVPNSKQNDTQEEQSDAGHRRKLSVRTICYSFHPAT